MKSGVSQSRPWWQFAAICLALAGLAITAYWPVHENEFINNYDDNPYITENTHVLHGLNWKDIKWAFTTSYTALPHPLTWLSHQLDCSLYGTWAPGHHYTGLAIHIVNSLLLFLLIWRMTRRFWPSAILAAVFAVHPLHVESVAWAAERKDVLSGLFFLLTLHAYLRYAGKPKVSLYLAVFALFVLGLLCKPMLVTLPFVLLLLDYWPLGRLRFSKKSFGRLIAEKIPLIFVALTWGIITFAIQKQAGVVVAETQLGPVSRIANAAISYVFYLWKTIWPTDLAVFYPYPSSLPWISFVFSTLLLIAISVFCVAKRKNSPYLIFGWLWYLGTLIPVIGLIQSGGQAHADRYTYLPQIGFCLAVIWQINDLSERWPHRRYLVGTAAAVALLFLAGRTWTQCAIWHNSESLWSHALAVTTDNATAHNHLADAFIRRGRLDEAVSQAELAIKISGARSPDNLYGYSNLGIALSRQGKTKEAIKYFEKVEKDGPNRPALHYNMAGALSDNGQWDEAISELQKELVIQPEFAEAHNNLGIALSKKGHLDEAIAQFQKALQLNPNAPKVNYNLADIFLQKGEMDAAIRHLKRELQIQPNQPDALNGLGIALSQEGLLSEALDQWQRTISVQPNNLNALCNLAWVYGTNPEPSIRNAKKALEFALRANELSGGNNPRILRLVAAAYAENGQFDEAIRVADKGAKLARDVGNLAMADVLMQNIASYQRNSPLRDSSQIR